MNHLGSETFPTSGHYAASSHHSGHSLIDTLVNGFAWRIGSDAANTVFHAAPAACLGLAAVAGVVYVLLRRKRGNRI